MPSELDVLSGRATMEQGIIDTSPEIDVVWPIGSVFAEGVDKLKKLVGWRRDAFAID
jgi:hypothetical protein